MRVTDPRGTTWRVSRRWVPWRRRMKGAMDWAPEFPALGDDPVSMVIGIAVLVVAIPFLVLAMVAGLELLLLLLVLPFAVLGRMAFGRHWHVEARRGFKIEFEVDAGDWQSSRVKIHEVADQLREGRLQAPKTADS